MDGIQPRALAASGIKVIVRSMAGLSALVRALSTRDFRRSEACRSSGRLAAYRRIRLSTFGRLRSAGFALLATFEHPHFTLVLSDISELTIVRLDRCFDDPIPNPAGGTRG